MSSPPIEEQTPSRIIEAIWWLAFIVPLIFVWLGTQNYFLIGFLIAARLLLMVYQKRREPKKKPVAVKPVEPETPSEEQAPVIQNNVSGFKYWKDILKDEAKDELIGLLKFLHIYDHKTEDRYLGDYRRLRGWDQQK